MKILIIDDDPAMTELLTMMLTPTKACIQCANSGIEGLELINTNHPDIVLLDLMMPEIDGWKITTEIRKTSAVPILILSVIDSPMMVAQVLDAGADDFLIKPVPREILLAHINNLARRKEMSRSQAQFAPLFESVYK